MDAKKQYTISFTGLAGARKEVVGQLALDLDLALQVPVNIPNGFVISSITFDDFLIANDLLEYISPRINEIDYGQLKTVKKASEEIMHAITNAIFPNIISDQILQAYSGLSGFAESFVALDHSPINDDLAEISYTIPTSYSNIGGRQELLMKVKEMWAKLFTPEALIHRSEIGYEGYITEAVVVKKMLQAEVSGKVYTYTSVDNKTNEYEIQAYFGLDDAKLWDEISPDTYIISPINEEIIEKSIVSQDWMLVRKGRVSDRNPIIKVPISKLWQKKQKLDDQIIMAIARYARQLKEKFGSHLEMSFEFESGRITFNDFIRISNVEEIEGIVEEVVPNKVAKINANQTEYADAKTVTTSPKSIDDYVAEVHQSKGVSSDINEVTTEILPFEDLEIITHGNTPIGFEDKPSSFGLIHHITDNNDFYDLTGDEILVVDQLQDEFLDKFNNVKGVVVKDEADFKVLRNIDNTIVERVVNAFEVFHEGEIVTIRPWNATIYGGAGKDKQIDEKTAEEYEPVKIESKVDQDGQNIKAETDGDPFFLDDQVDAKSDPVDQFDNLIKLPSKGLDKKSNSSQEYSQVTNKVREIELPKTITDFWQVCTDSTDEVDMKNIDGVVVRVSDLIEHFDKRTFVANLSSKILEILVQVDGKPVILISAGHGKYAEEIVKSELEMLRKIRNKDSYTNLWYSLDNIHRPDDLVNFKRMITDAGFRRSATFKVFLTLHSPHSVISLKGLLENEVDGVIVDADLLKHEHMLNEDLHSKYVKDYIVNIFEIITDKKSQGMFLCTDNDINKDLIDDIIHTGGTAIATNLDKVYDLKEYVSKKENLKLMLNRKKKGRKRKEIDFGF